MASSDTLKLQVLLDTADKVSAPMRAMGKNTQRTIQRMGELRDVLKTMGKVEQNIGQFKELKRSLPQAARDAKQARAKLRELEQQLEATTEPSRKLTRAVDKARKASDKATTQWRGQAHRLRDVRERLREAGVSTHNLRRQESQLRGKIEKTNEALERQKRRLSDVRRAQHRLGQMREKYDSRQQNAANTAIVGATTMAAGRGILTPIIASLKAGARFQSQLRDQAITGDMSKAKEQALGQIVRKQARRWGVDTGQVFQATGSLVSSGITDTAKLRQAAALLTKVQVATGAEMQDLGQLSVALRQNLGINEDMAATYDALAYAGKAGKFELKDMAKWMPKLGAAMHAMGGKGKGAAVSLAAAMQVVRMGAGSSDEAGNNLQNFMKKITSQVTIKNFGKMGIDYKARMAAFAKQGIGPIVGSIKLIKEALAKSSPEASKALMTAAHAKDPAEKKQALQRVQALSKSFGLGQLFQDQQAMAAILPLLANMDKFQTIRTNAMHAQGTIDTDADKRMQTLTKQWDKAAENAKDLAISVSKILAPAVTKLLHWLSNLAQTIQKWTAKHPQLTAAIVKTAAVLGGLLTVLGGLAVAMAAVMGPLAMLQFGFGRLRLLFGGAGGKTRALGKGIRWLAQSAKALGGKTIGIIAKFGKVLASTGLKGILAVAKGAKVLGRVMLGVGRALMTNPILAILGIIALAAYAIYKNWDVIKPKLIAFWNAIKRVALVVWHAIKGAALAVWHAIKQGVLAYFAYIMRVLNLIKSAAVAVWTGIKSVAIGAWDGIKAGVMTVFNWIGKKIQWVYDKIMWVKRKWDALWGDQDQKPGPQNLPKISFMTPSQAAQLQNRPPARATPPAGPTTIHVYPSPGMDEHALAHAVRQQMDARDREQAATRRSALADMD